VHEESGRRYVLGLEEIDQTQVAVVGGKGAHLGELSRIEGIRVPAGLCVTTDAFQRIMAEASSSDWLGRLSGLNPDDRDAIRALSAEIRRALEGTAIPDDLAAAILEHVSRCWASLFSERAVTYRLRNGFDHGKVQMAVVVQQMVFPLASVSACMERTGTWSSWTRVRSARTQGDSPVVGQWPASARDSPRQRLMVLRKAGTAAIAAGVGSQTAMVR
jgi:phosphoenolpyruvate synthase/pyruvate phosphate dikinase